MIRNKLLLKLLKRRIWHRIYRERLGEPLLYQFVSLFVLLFGSTRRKIEYDLVPRHAYAFGLQAAADHARSLGHSRVMVVEFGVAAGTGLLNMCEIASAITRESGVAFEIVGFDTGTGMPPPRDYRDHPEKYYTGDYPPVDKDALVAALPANARIIYGDIAESVRSFPHQSDAPLGFVSIDVDYYWSTKECLSIFLSEPEHYLPYVITYLDDTQGIDDNEFCGELLAVREFNETTPLRKIARANHLECHRIFKSPLWLRQIYLTHVLDHQRRTIDYQGRNRTTARKLDNPFL